LGLLAAGLGLHSHLLLLRARLLSTLRHRLHVFRLERGCSGFSSLSIKPFLALDVSLVLFEFLILLAAHVVNAFVCILRHLIYKFAKFVVLLIGHFLDHLLHILQPKFLHACLAPLCTFRLSNLRELVLAYEYINRLIRICLKLTCLRPIDN